MFIRSNWEYLNSAKKHIWNCRMKNYWLAEIPLRAQQPVMHVALLSPWFVTNVFFYDAPICAQISFQQPATQIMSQIIDLHHDIFALLLFLCVLVFYLLVVVAWKFSAHRNTESWTDDLPFCGGYKSLEQNISFRANTPLEVVWTLIPMLVVLSILYPSFALLYAMDELKDPSITVKIIGHQWYWHYELPISFTTHSVDKFISFDSYMLSEKDLPFGGFRLLEVDNPLRLPVKTTIRLLITAADVLHSWAVPSFGIKVDACPGRLNQTSVFIERLGTFYGQCSEICGVNHGFMPISVESRTVSEIFSRTNHAIVVPSLVTFITNK